jgi:chromosomal replication initiation ATPase DnaA
MNSESELLTLLKTIHEIKELLSKVAEVSNVTVEDIKGLSRKNQLPFIRGSFVYLVHEIYPDATRNMVGSMINRNHSTISWMLFQTRGVKEKFGHYWLTKERLKQK